MNREDVIQLAREAGFDVYPALEEIDGTFEAAARFAAAIEQRTLERAAQACSDLKAPPSYGVVETSTYEVATLDCEAAIRALKEKA